MKIVKFEEFHVDCGWEIYSFLKISTDEGLAGWSEFKEHRRPGVGAAIQGMARTADRPGPARDRPHRGCALFVHAHGPGRAQPNAAGAILNACLDIKGKALGVPVYELFGGAVRDRIPVYWSRCGVIRARCAEYFDGKVIDKPAVHTVDDLKARRPRGARARLQGDQRPTSWCSTRRAAASTRRAPRAGPAIPSSTCRRTCSTR